MTKRTVLLLQLATGLGAMSYGTMFTVLDDFRDDYGVSEAQLGLILAVGFLAGFVAQIFLAPFADKGHAKKMIMVGITVEIVGNLMMGFGASFPVLFAARLIGGIGAGMVYPAVRRVVILADPENMGNNLGRMVSFDVGGFSIGPVLSAVTVGALGLAAPFIICCVGLAVVGLGLIRLHVQEAVGEVPTQRLAFDLLRIRPYLGAVIIGLSLYLMIGTFDALWSVMMDDMEAAEWVANVGITVFALPMLFLGPFGGRLTQRFGPFRASIAGLSVAAFFMSMYGLLGSPYVMLGFGVAHGIVDGLTITGGAAAVAMVAPKERLASAQGLFGGLQTIMGGIAAAAAGATYGAFGRTPAFLTTATVMLLFVGTGAFLARGHLRMTPADGEPAAAVAAAD
jgi:MFS family permease